MDGMLSQEEINALLNSTIMPSADPVPSYEPSEKLSMAE